MSINNDHLISAPYLNCLIVNIIKTTTTSNKQTKFFDSFWKPYDNSLIFISLSDLL